jgi:DNA-binding response OmpR family regulator
VPAHLNILVVEDHDFLREVTVDMLCQHGHQASGVACAEDIDDFTGNLLPDLYLIDLNLPGEDGLSLAKRIRGSHPAVGIIMVTARHQLQDKVAGYQSGADIYLAKPVEPEELLAAIESLRRRLKPDHDSSAETLIVDVQRLMLRGPLGETALSQAEATLLSAFASAAGQSLERWQVALKLGQGDAGFSESSLEVRIGRLRRKLSDVGGTLPAIKAIRSVGYKLCLAICVI